MRANHQPDALRLKLRTPPAGASVDDALAQSLGDPCYLHELGHRTDGWSRKQLEMSVKRLDKVGRITVLGRGTRRLYCTPRPVPQVLLGLPAKAVRLLQMMPLEGDVPYRMLCEVSQDAAGCLDRLGEAGLTARDGRTPASVRLTGAGRKAAAPLGSGIRLDRSRIRELAAHMNPVTDREIEEALASRRPLPEPTEGRERALVRRMLCARLVHVIDQLDRGGKTVAEQQRRTDDVLRGSGITPHAAWLYNLRNNGRLPDRHEIRALATVLGESPSCLDAHLAVAPWALEESKRAPSTRRRRRSTFPSSLVKT
jgi:hypothetical protein